MAPKKHWLLQFLGFFVIGAVVVFCANRLLGVMALALVIAVPLLILVFVLSFKYALNGLRSLRKSFSWWHGVWLLLFVSGLTWHDRTVQQIAAEAVDKAAAVRIALVGIVALILLIRLALRRTGWLRSMSKGLLALLSAYGSVCLASTLWSVYPAWTLYRSVEFLVDIAALAAIVATLVSARGCKALFDWTWALEGLLLASVWLGAIISPGKAFLTHVGTIGFQLSGVVPNVSSNSVGELGAVLGLVALCRLLLPAQKASRPFYMSLLSVGIVSMIFAQTRSAILGFVLGVAVIFLVSGRIRLGAAIGVATAALTLASSVGVILSNFMRRGETPEQIRTLTERVVWWQAAWSKFVEHPLIGFGAYAGGRFFVLPGIGEDVSSLHSDYVGILVDTGLWGFVFAAAVVIGTWASLIHCLRSVWLSPIERCLVIEAVGVLTEMTVRSFFSPALLWHFPMVFFAIVAYAEFLRRQVKRRRRAALRSRDRGLALQSVG